MRSRPGEAVAAATTNKAAEKADNAADSKAAGKHAE
jgi:hypothetical protein